MPKSTTEGSAPLLSICIATLQRARLLESTLEQLLPQLTSDTELVIVDGSSDDDTETVVRAFAGRFAATSYQRYDDRGGLDRDYDRAVDHAGGTFCWLLTDDDALLPGAVTTILETLTKEPDLVVLNTEVRDEKLDRVLQSTRLREHRCTNYPSSFDDRVLVDLGDTLSFIGSVVIRRDCWLERERSRFYGSMFIHVGVILQRPALERVHVIDRPLLALRYGNASWSSRYFEIWAFLWPQMIWQFTQYSVTARAAVTPQQPWRSPMFMLKQRARGAYNLEHYRRYLGSQPFSIARLAALLVALCPGVLVNLLAVAFITATASGRYLGMYDLLRSPHSSRISRWLGRRSLRGVSR